MTKVRLEIDEVHIKRRRKRWVLYFVIMAEHPDDPEKMIITTLPQYPFKLSSTHENSYHFDTTEEGSEGLFVLSRELPEDREINVHVYLRHTRSKTRNLGEILNDLKSGIGGDAMDIVTNIAGTATVPWLIIAKKAVPMVGKILMQIKDKDFGFLSCFERFGPEFENEYEIDREKDFTGDASLVYSWSIDES